MSQQTSAEMFGGLSNIGTEAGGHAVRLRRLNQHGGRKNEPSRIDQENTSLFEQLVLRAIGEEEITVSKGAELLKISLSDMRHMTMLQEEC